MIKFGLETAKDLQDLIRKLSAGLTKLTAIVDKLVTINNKVVVIFKRSHQTGSTATSAVAFIVPWDGLRDNIDTAGGYTGSAYVIPETGYYDIGVKVTLQGTNTMDTDDYCVVDLLVDTVSTEVSIIWESDLSSSVAMSPAAEINCMKYLTKGQSLTVQLLHTSSAATLDMDSDARHNWFHVAKRG